MVGDQELSLKSGGGAAALTGVGVWNDSLVARAAHGWHAAVEATDLAGELDIVQPGAEVVVVDLEEDLAREEGVGARLVLGPDPLHLEFVGHGLEAAHEVVRAQHQILDVVQVGKVNFQGVQELSFTVGQTGGRELGKEVAKVVGGVEGDPGHVVHQDQARAQQTLRKVTRLNPLETVLLKVEAGAPEQIYRVLGVQILHQVELEVELPGADSLGQVPRPVKQSNTQLDQFEKVHIALDKLVFVLVRRAEVAHGLGHYPGELGVHGHKGILRDQVNDLPKLLVKVVGPHLADLVQVFIEVTFTGRVTVVVLCLAECGLLCCPVSGFTVLTQLIIRVAAGGVILGYAAPSHRHELVPTNLFPVHRIVLITVYDMFLYHNWVIGVVKEHCRRCMFGCL